MAVFSYLILSPMKTERRHDLETNLLARKLAGWVEHVKPFSNATGVVAIALVVALVGWFFLNSQTANRESVAWDDYFLATLGRPIEPAKLQATAQQHSGSSVAHWANLTSSRLGSSTWISRALSLR